MHTFDVYCVGQQADGPCAAQALPDGVRLFPVPAARDAAAGAAALNERVRTGGGDCLVFCAPGVRLLPGFFARLSEALEADADAVCFEPRRTPQEDTRFYHPVTLALRAAGGPCFAVRREAFLRTEGFSAADLGAARMGAGLCARLAGAGPAARYVPQACFMLDGAPPAGDADGFRRAGAPLAAPPAAFHAHFTLIIRAWKRPALLDNALACLRHQTWRDFDVVVVEDGAGPVCGDVVRRHAQALPLTYLPLARDAGRSAAANAGMAAAQGPWLAFLDDDDLLFADHFETAAAALAAAPGCRMLALGAVEAAAESGCAVYPDAALKNHVVRQFSLVQQCRNNLFPIQTVVFHKDLFTQYGGMDETLDALEDWDLWTRYACHAKVALFEKATSLFHTPADPAARLDRIERMDAWKAKLAEKWKSYPLAVTAADVLLAGWDPQAQREACEQARIVLGRRETVRALQASRMRAATRWLRGPGKLAQRLAGPDDIDPDTASPDALEHQIRAIRASALWRLRGR